MAARAEQAGVESRFCQLHVVSEALAEAERGRRELLAANERLRRLQRVLGRELDAIDEWSEGRLRELVEQAGDELAALVDLVLDGREAVG